MSEPVSLKEIESYFNDPRTVDHYARAVSRVGLWESERVVFQQRIRRADRVLDLGCGAGRIAIGLWNLGYRDVAACDLSSEMVEETRRIASSVGASISARREDATRLRYPQESFDAVVFGFNGLMQIPGWRQRRAALREIKRILMPGGVFIFTTLDREDALYRSVFADERALEHDHARNSLLLEFGDRHFETAHGTTFMHVPTCAETETALQDEGWELVENRMRSEISVESAAVWDFAENCRFWIVKKPAS